ncbi:MAG TPA: LUD domain-containing protein [Jiangellaceae bacterium]
MNGPTARDDVLRRIRTALGDEDGVPVPIPRDYRGAEYAEPATGDRASPEPGSPEAVLLADRIGEYRAVVRRCEPSQVAGEIAAALRARGVRRLVVPAGLYPPWLYEIPDGIEVIGDDPPLTPQQLDEVDGVLTGCAVAIAETGTVVLDAGPGQGRRILTLVPDYHLVVVQANRIVPSVPAAVAMLDPSRPLTWISGPSATSDIELDRIEGVHGPRNLEVVVAGW